MSYAEPSSYSAKGVPRRLWPDYTKTGFYKRLAQNLGRPHKAFEHRSEIYLKSMKRGSSLALREKMYIISFKKTHHK